jgi:hypothetical protein
LREAEDGVLVLLAQGHDNDRHPRDSAGLDVLESSRVSQHRSLTAPNLGTVPDGPPRPK